MALKPSNLKSNKAGFPTALKASGIELTRIANIALHGLPTVKPILFNLSFLADRATSP